MAAAGKSNRHGHRDSTMILLAFRHGLRASELCSLRWEQVDLVHGRLHVARAKNGMPSVHPLTGAELRALRRLQREQEPGRYLFMSERGAPMTPDGFKKLIGRLGSAAKMPFPIHPHMLRHACGYKPANQGVDTRSLSTTWATRTSSTRCAIPSCRRNGSATSGRIEAALDARMRLLGTSPLGTSLSGRASEPAAACAPRVAMQLRRRAA
jgi:type 1 fimbriae regulatory protein FimB/type 1 fimbriae regulatory protein FimE